MVNEPDEINFRKGYECARDYPGTADEFMNRPAFTERRNGYSRSTFSGTPIHQAFRRGIEAFRRGDPLP